MDIIKEIKTEIDYQIDNLNVSEIEKLAEIIKQTKGIIYFMGIGKSGNIAKHCCDLLKSISIKGTFLETVNALHGDIGTMDSNDTVIMFSKSGNTKELMEIIPYMKMRKSHIIGICCDSESLFKTECDLTIETPFMREINGEINKIPTNSCMSHLLFINVLVSILKQNITIHEYKENHPAGNIGNNLKRIKDVMINEFPKIVMREKINMNDIFLKMTDHCIGCCFFVDTNDTLLGILTDGDIRRLLLKHSPLTSITIDNINEQFDYETNTEKFVCDISKKNAYIPVLQDKKIIGFFRTNS